MPQPERRARLDSYGKPLPILTEVEGPAGEERFDHPSNQARRRFLHQLVDDMCDAVMRHDWWGRATIAVQVDDGILHPGVTAGLERSWRPPPEEGTSHRP